MYDYFTFNIDVFKAQIQAYNPQVFDIGIAKESGLVPLLLAPIWLLFPYLQVTHALGLWGLTLHCMHLSKAARSSPLQFCVAESYKCWHLLIVSCQTGLFSCFQYGLPPEHVCARFFPG